MCAYKVRGLVGTGWSLKVVLFGFQIKKKTWLLTRYVTLGKLITLNVCFLIFKVGMSVAPMSQGPGESLMR